MVKMNLPRPILNGVGSGGVGEGKMFDINKTNALWMCFVFRDSVGMSL